MSKLRAAKRKKKMKQQNKKRREEYGFAPKFSGYWKLYLNGASPEALRDRNEFFGDWQDKKNYIFSKPRQFKIVIYPVTLDGDKLDEVSLLINGTLEYSELSQIIFKYAMEIFEDMSPIIINTTDSYATIRA